MQLVREEADRLLQFGNLLAQLVGNHFLGDSGLLLSQQFFCMMFLPDAFFMLGNPPCTLQLFLQLRNLHRTSIVRCVGNLGLGVGLALLRRTLSATALRLLDLLVRKLLDVLMKLMSRRISPPVDFWRDKIARAMMMYSLVGCLNLSSKARGQSGEACPNLFVVLVVSPLCSSSCSATGCSYGADLFGAGLALDRDLE